MTTVRIPPVSDRAGTDRLDPTGRRALRAIAAFRTALGLGALVAPHRTGPAFGMDMDRNVSAPYFARLFGSRELLLAAPVWFDLGVEPDALNDLGVLADVLDVVAAVAGRRAGYLPTRALVIAGLSSAASAATGVVVNRHRR